MTRTEVPLAEIAAIVPGQSPPGSSYNEDAEGLPFFQGKAEFGEVSPTPKKWCTEPKRVAEAGDILISVRAPIGPTNIASETCCIGRGLAAIRPNPQVADKRFILYSLQYHQPTLEAKGQGSTFTAISRRDLESLSIDLPSLPEQRRIVDILDRAKAVKRLRESAHEKARKAVPALLIKALGDPTTNPLKWPIRRLGELIAEGPQNGLYRPQSDYGQGTPIVRIDSFYGGNILEPHNLQRLSLDGDTVERYLLAPGDILVNRVNSRSHLGKSAIVPELEEPTVFESNMMRFSLKEEVVLPKYVIASLQTEFVKKQVLSKAKDAINQSSINQTDVKSLQIPVPPLEQQKLFTTRLEEVESVIHSQAYMAPKAEQLTSSLMSKLLGRPSGTEQEQPSQEARGA